MWDSVATDITIKRRHTIPYELNMRSNKVIYSTSTWWYCTKHDVKVPFLMPEFSSRRIILHRFHVNKNEGESSIVYYIIICRDMMVQLCPSANFRRQFLQWDGATLPMKEPRNLLGKPYLTSCDMREVEIQTTEPVSTRGYT